MYIDLCIKKAHNSNKKHTEEVIMFELINPIVRNVAKIDLKQYLSEKGIRESSIDWSLTSNLLPIEIEKILNSAPNKNKKESVLSDFSRVLKLAKEDQISICISFLLFVNFRKRFESKESSLDENNQYKKFLQNILNNGRLLSALFFLISFFINLAQICSDENDSKYIALNVFHFIIGGLTVFCFNNNGNKK